MQYLSVNEVRFDLYHYNICTYKASELRKWCESSRNMPNLIIGCYYAVWRPPTCVCFYKRSWCNFFYQLLVGRLKEPYCFFGSTWWLNIACLRIHRLVFKYTDKCYPWAGLWNRYETAMSVILFIYSMIFWVPYNHFWVLDECYA